MIRYFGGVREVAREISSAADGALNAYRDGRVTEEPNITERIIGAIEDRIGGKRPDGEARPYDRGATSPLGATGASDRLVEGDDAEAPHPVLQRINWTARSLRTGSGIAAEEKRHGADLMGIVDIDIPQFRVVKGFLAQAKRAEPGRVFKDWDRLQAQCETMLLRTPDSFVWVYSKAKGIRIFPAVAVSTLKSKDIFDLYSRSVSSFFESHIECFIGDGRLNSTKIETLDVLAEIPIENVLELSGRQ